MRIAINGLGRIGRTMLRQILTSHPDIVVSHINDIADPVTLAYLMQYDSVFGPWPGEVTLSDGALHIAGRIIPLSRHADLTALDLTGCDLVLECTGHADTRDVATRGLTAGARRVLISGPSEAAEITIVLGANDVELRDESIVSNASCTTNALAPLLAALDARHGIKTGHMTTIHCYTGSQPMVDTPRGDPARSRAGAVSMVPTTTSATKLIDRILPHLAGRVTGAAVRVPSISVSAIDLTCTLHNPPADAVKALQTIADASPYIGTTNQPLVSIDLRARPESLILALPETIPNGPQLRLFGWYDNEWGFSARMIDMARRMT